MSNTFKKTILLNLGLQLRQIRIDKGLETADVALHSDLSMETITNIERGSKASFAKFSKLLRFYKKELEIIIKDK